MNLLDFGMKYEKSRSRPLRIIAGMALWIERKRADHYERRLEKKKIIFPNDAAQDDFMLDQIKERILQEKKK